MAITQAVCTSFKLDLLDGSQDLDNDTLKIALYTSTATLGASTTAYSATNEIVGTGYTAGGATLANVTVSTDTTTAIFDCDDPAWTGASFTVRGALIYNSTAANASIIVLDFGGDFVVSSGTFTVNIPAAAAATALIRIA